MVSVNVGISIFFMKTAETCQDKATRMKTPIRRLQSDMTPVCLALFRAINCCAQFPRCNVQGRGTACRAPTDRFAARLEISLRTCKQLSLRENFNESRILV